MGRGISKMLRIFCVCMCCIPGHFFSDNACDKPLRMDEEKAKDKKLKYKLKIER